MERVLEPELMESEDQAKAYAQADFKEAEHLFMQHFKEKIGVVQGRALDIGCGPARISLQVAQENPDCMVFALDGSKEMLERAQESMRTADEAKGRVILIHQKLVNAMLPQRDFQLVTCNSLLHHLHDPMQLWNALKIYADANAWIFIMDLFRPTGEEEAKNIVEKYSKDEAEVLKKDFYNSLLAAFEEKEIRDQLQQAGLQHLQTEIISDRHILIYGRM